MKNKFNLIEIKTLVGLGSVFFLRMLGTFMILPILASYGMSLKDATNNLIGITIGIYGFFQATLQMPFGLLSDYIGSRKKVIILGLTLLLVGSIISANSLSIWSLIIGRALQGAGAITATSIALLFDTVREHKRAQAMGIIGVIFSISFCLAMLIGPIITNTFGFKFTFWMMGILSIICIITTIILLPNSTPKKYQAILKDQIIKLFFNKNLSKINFSIFFLHTLLIVNFIILPSLLKTCGDFIFSYYEIYFFTILISFIMISILIKKFKLFYEKITSLLVLCIFLIFISENIFIIGSITNNIFILILGLQFFFFSFTLTEIILPYLVSIFSLKEHRGTAMGIYSSTQFFGIACGGALGGWVLEINKIIVFSCLTCATIIWFFIVLKIKKQYVKLLNK